MPLALSPNFHLFLSFSTLSEQGCLIQPAQNIHSNPNNRGKRYDRCQGQWFAILVASSPDDVGSDEADDVDGGKVIGGVRG